MTNAEKQQMIELQQKQTELLVDLGETGDATANEISSAIVEYTEKWKTAGPEARKQINAIIARLQALLQAQKKVAGWGGHAPGTGPLEFDEGGWVPGPKGAAQMAIVHGGEYVVPADEAATASQGLTMLGSGIGGWGGRQPIVTAVHHTHIHLDGREIAAVVDEANYYPYSVAESATTPA
jgi:hypothetical protein